MDTPNATSRDKDGIAARTSRLLAHAPYSRNSLRARSRCHPVRLAPGKKNKTEKRTRHHQLALASGTTAGCIVLTLEFPSTVSVPSDPETYASRLRCDSTCAVPNDSLVGPDPSDRRPTRAVRRPSSNSHQTIRTQGLAQLRRPQLVGLAERPRRHRYKHPDSSNPAQEPRRILPKALLPGARLPIGPSIQLVTRFLRIHAMTFRLQRAHPGPG